MRDNEFEKSLIRTRDDFDAKIEVLRAQLKTKPPKSEGDTRLLRLKRFIRARERCETTILRGYPEKA